MAISNKVDQASFAKSDLKVMFYIRMQIGLAQLMETYLFFLELLAIEDISEVSIA